MPTGRLRPLLARLRPLLAHLWPLLAAYGPYWPAYGPYWVKKLLIMNTLIHCRTKFDFLHLCILTAHEQVG